MKIQSEISPATGKPTPIKPKRTGPPNYFSRGEQLRLLVLCSTLMFVLVMMNEARKPATWDWLWASETTEAAATAEPIDTRIEAPDRQLPADGFTVEKATAADAPVGTRSFLPGITAELLNSIKDNTVMRAAENEAWMTMLVALKSRSIQQLDSLSLGNVGFAQLYQQTDFYRGQLVTVSGTARRLEAITPRKNSHGIEQLYRWILRPHGSSTPIVIYSLEKPPQIEPNDEMREPCEFTGFCFKRWAYPAGDGTRVAPLLLAKTPQWQPAPPPANTPLPSAATITACFIGLLCMSAGIAYAVYRSANVTRADIDRLRIAEDDLQENLLAEPVLPGAAEALRAMGQSASESDS